MDHPLAQSMKRLDILKESIDEALREDFQTLYTEDGKPVQVMKPKNVTVISSLIREARTEIESESRLIKNVEGAAQPTNVVIFAEINNIVKGNGHNAGSNPYNLRRDRNDTSDEVLDRSTSSSNRNIKTF